MSRLLDFVSAVLILTGAVFTLIAAVGLHRMPDTYRRLHISTKPAVFAVVCTFTGAALQMPLAPDAAKLAVALVLQLVTAPVAAHLLGSIAGLESQDGQAGSASSGNDSTTSST